MRKLDDCMLDDTYMYLVTVGNIPRGHEPRIGSGCGRLWNGMKCYAYPLSPKMWKVPAYDIILPNEFVFSFVQQEHRSEAYYQRREYARKNRFRAQNGGYVSTLEAFDA